MGIAEPLCWRGHAMGDEQEGLRDPQVRHSGRSDHEAEAHQRCRKTALCPVTHA